ncbi:hypothetical protein D3C73_1128090 [compost metagenome]
MHFGIQPQHIGVQRLGEHRVVGAARQDPGFGSGRQRGLGPPDGARHRQLGQRVRLFHGVHLIDQQAEAIAHVDQAGIDCRAGRSRENQPRRICLATNTERLDIQQRFRLLGDRRADLQHMRADHQIVARLEVIGVILHKRGAAV